MVRVPVTVPLAGAVKVTMIAQLPFAATLVPHVLVWAKLVPPVVIPMLVTARALLLLLVSVTFWDVTEGENERLEGETPTLAPVPVKLIQRIVKFRVTEAADREKTRAKTPTKR